MSEAIQINISTIFKVVCPSLYFTIDAISTSSQPVQTESCTTQHHRDSSSALLLTVPSRYTVVSVITIVCYHYVQGHR